MEGQCSAVTEIQEFLKKRGDLEQEHSKQLDKLVSTFQSKLKGFENQRK